jgi:16S rRNA (uracil1498-N3)-methyltransferase
MRKREIGKVRRFFIAKDAITQEGARISGTDAHHLRHVLRLERGEKIILVAEGREYLAEIKDFAEDHVFCHLHETYPGRGEPPVEVTLLQGMPKGEKLELVIQKAVEVGVSRIVLLETERSVVKLDPVKAEQRLKRWRRIATEAAKQCGRSVVPPVEGIYKLPLWLEKGEMAADALFLVPWENAQQPGIREALREHHQARQVCILIGPEGGLTSSEVETAKKFGGLPVTLGPRILRTETAAIVAPALVLYQAGDLN